MKMVFLAIVGCSVCESYSPSGRLRACLVTDTPKGKKAESKEQQYLEVFHTSLITITVVACASVSNFPNQCVWSGTWLNTESRIQPGAVQHSLHHKHPVRAA